MGTTSSAPGEERVFRIALSMSGAISAGAYTAGVFDFLVQALAELDFARNRKDHPDHVRAMHHAVKIVAVAGASAGGATAALGSIALGYGTSFQVDPATPFGRQPVLLPAAGSDRAFGVLPRLFDAWVVRPRMVGGDGTPGLLSTGDLTGPGAAGGKIVSLLNASVLDGIRDAALSPPEPRPAAAQAAPFGFLFDCLHVYLTITNLAGVQYDVKGATETDAYHMVTHADRLHFKIGGLGTGANHSGGWADRDKGEPLDRNDLAGGPVPAGWRRLADGALATAAFPAGLAARVLNDTQDGYRDRWFPAPDFHGGATIDPFFPPPPYPQGLSFSFVDGGVINNDPFDFARYALLKNWQDSDAANDRNSTTADRAVIMISPFPEGARTGTYKEPDTALVKVLRALFPTLLQQARFKVGELAAAADPNTASRWLIAPRRRDGGGAPSSQYIACAALGGFGGFLDQGFREHDYNLGRRNCQQFLRNWKLNRFDPVIPLLGSAVAEIPQPQWPVMSQADFDSLMDHIAARTRVVLRRLIEQFVPTAWYLRWTGWPANKLASWASAHWLMPYLRKAIASDLNRDDSQKQLEVNVPWYRRPLR